LCEQVAQMHNRDMSDQHNSCARGNFSKLRGFRQAAYVLMGKAQDALFELTDAVIQMQHPQSFVELSCAPAFRRKWSSAYEALQDGRLIEKGYCICIFNNSPTNPIDFGGGSYSLATFMGQHTGWTQLSAPGFAYSRAPSGDHRTWIQHIGDHSRTQGELGAAFVA
jgi:hypothetical protein